MPPEPILKGRFEERLHGSRHVATWKRSARSQRVISVIGSDGVVVFWWCKGNMVDILGMTGYDPQQDYAVLMTI